MRVRVLKTVRGFWNWGIQTWEPGEEVTGDLARHLADNSPEGFVEVTEADPEPEETEDPADPGDAAGGEGSDSQQDTGESGDEPPVDGTIDQLMTWVGNDPARAGQALAAEQAKDKPRSTAVKLLAALAEE